ncbi:MAG: TetR family transcriptional regulator [Isosphaeraceae bacterium]
MDKPTVDPTKTRLLEAAGEEFATHGFELATVRAICQRAGTNVAAINYHFGDKEQLYIQAVLEAHRCSMRPLPVVDIENHAPADLLRQFIHQFLENVLSLNGLDSWHNTLMLREMLRPTKACENARPRHDPAAVCVVA